MAHPPFRADALAVDGIELSMPVSDEVNEAMARALDTFEHREELQAAYIEALKPFGLTLFDLLPPKFHCVIYPEQVVPGGASVRLNEAEEE